MLTAMAIMKATPTRRNRQTVKNGITESGSTTCRFFYCLLKVWSQDMVF